MNRITFPFPGYPLSGDINSQPGTNYVTVTGIQHFPVLGIQPVNGDILMFQSAISSPALNDWVPTPWGIMKVSVSPSSSPAGVLTIDAELGNSFRINVNQAIGSMSIINPSEGQEITLLWVQDGTGHAITLAGNLKGATAPSTGAGTVSCQKFTYDLTKTNWYATAPGQTGM